jgi:HTH-type transcriptional regulator / antitoxin HigA
MNGTKMITSFQPFIQFNHATGGIVPAQTQADYLHLLGLMQDLTDQYSPDDPRVIALFDILSRYIGEWENQFEFPQGNGADVLRHLMQQHQLSQSDLAGLGIASQSLLSNVLSGRRSISKRLAQALAAHFGVGVESFL